MVDRVNVKPARQEWILALYQRLCDTTNEEHRRNKQPNEDDRLPGDEDEHCATSGGREDNLRLGNIVMRFWFLLVSDF
jgi:hypothetical protein